MPVFGADAGIVFPNATSIEDVDGDGDGDIIVPSGYFFGTDPAPGTPAMLSTTGAITWWENRGTGTPFAKHVVVQGQAGSYHGVQLADLDGDGVKDLISVSEEAKAAGELTDDEVTTQFFKGTGSGTFAAPVTLAAGLGGSQPVIHDVDGDGDLDIVTSQYFRTINDVTTSAAYLWLENKHSTGALSSADFTPHTIAKTADVGMGFQIRPVPGFREPGKVSWIGTNHVNRCTFKILLPAFAWPEQVIEFTPGADLTAPWTRTTLSDPATAPEPCPADYNNRAKYLEWSNAITSRYGPGQGAPGVFGYGDLDGDQDVDLAVSGDGDRRLWWVENRGGAGTALHQLTNPGEYFGQAGGAAVVDLNGNGTSELIFSSFDTNTLAVWSRDPITYAPKPPAPTATPTVTPKTIKSTLAVTPAKRSAKAGTKVTFQVRLKTAPGGAARTVSVVFDPTTKGRTVKVGTVKLRPVGSAGVRRGRVTFVVRKAGKVVVTYAGSTVSPTLNDTKAIDAARVLIRR
nr:VCBS repeat-containing protein [Nocardioides sp. MAH-18]